MASKVARKSHPRQTRPRSGNESAADKIPRQPKYRHHRGTGQALVSINGKRIYLGKYDSAASKEKYRQLVAEMLVGQGKPPAESAKGQSPALPVSALVIRYYRWAKKYYSAKCAETVATENGHLCRIRRALRAVRKLYGRSNALEFGPRKLRAVQESLVSDGLSRTYINNICGEVRRLFRWAASHEFVPAEIHAALETVPGLKIGRTSARETAPVMPVDDATIQRTLPHLPPVVADMVRLLRLMGCRPGELCRMRPREVDRSDAVWCYVPKNHKNKHRGQQRRIFIGPKAQEILGPYLDRHADDFCFQPRDSETRRRAALRANRKTRVQPSQLTRRSGRPRKFKPIYDRHSLGHAIRQACAKAAKLKRPRKPGDPSKLDAYKLALAQHNVALREVSWHPNRLRHSAATDIRKMHGLEAAQTILGHSRADTTQIYAERDFSLAANVVGQMG